MRVAQAARAQVPHGYQPASTATTSRMKKAWLPCTITLIHKLRKRLAAQASKQLAIKLGQYQIRCRW